MYITSITTPIFKTDRFANKIIGTRTSNFGKLYNGDRIVIETDKYNDKTMEKTYIIWNDVYQRIFVKTYDKIKNRFDML